MSTVYRSVPAIPALRAAGRPVVFSPYFHVAPVTRLRRITRHAYRQVAGRAIASADLAVCASSAEAAALQTSVSALKGRVRIVRPGADGAAIIAAEPFEKTRRTIVTLGPLERGKRIDRVISTLPDLGPDYEVVVVGRGPERRPLRAHSVNLGVAQQVRFVGPIEDEELFRWLHTADVVVTMADEAMSGTTLLEAACAGAPVIASDIAAHTEIGAHLGSEAVRLISPQASPLDLADEIKFAAVRPRTLLDVAEVPSWDDMASQMAALYRTVPDAPTARTRVARARPLGLIDRRRSLRAADRPRATWPPPRADASRSGARAPTPCSSARPRARPSPSRPTGSRPGRRARATARRRTPRTRGS